MNGRFNDARDVQSEEDDAEDDDGRRLELRRGVVLQGDAVDDEEDCEGADGDSKGEEPGVESELAVYFVRARTTRGVYHGTPTSKRF